MPDRDRADDIARSGGLMCAWRSLLPTDVADAVLVGPDRNLGPIALRRRHHLRGRQCVRRALARLGVPERVAPRALSGRPLWPAGVVGSITHCDGFVGAVVARASAWKGIGCDAEVRRRVRSSDLPRIAARDEQTGRQRVCPEEDFPTLLLSAKESVFKALPDVGAARFNRFSLSFCPRRRAFWIAGSESRCLARFAPRLTGRYVLLARHVVCVADWR